MVWPTVSRHMLLFFCVLPTLPAVCATYAAVDLTPSPAYSEGQVRAGAGGIQGGFSLFTTGTTTAEHALFWSGSAASYVDLTPTANEQHQAASGADVFAITPTVQAGQATIQGVQAAGYWTGTANSFTALPTGGLSETEALGAADTSGGTVFAGDDLHSGQALLWKPAGGGSYALTNLHTFLPAGAYSQSVAWATDGASAVGQATVADSSGAGHAVVWNVASGASMDLNGDAALSDARAVFGNNIAGYANSDALLHAVLWRFDGTQYQMTNLNPDGASESEAFATRASEQAGYAVVDDSGNPHAYVWMDGPAGTFTGIDLEGTLDPSLYTGSEATEIDGDGDVVGLAFSTDGTIHPMLWKVGTPEPGTVGVLGLGAVVVLRRRRAWSASVGAR